MLVIDGKLYTISDDSEVPAKQKLPNDEVCLVQIVVKEEQLLNA